MINRSDGSRFHLSLFSGAEYVPAPSGGIAGNRLLGDFRCVHDGFGDSASPSIVVLTNPGDSHEGVRRQLEEAADQLAEVLQRNVRPSQRYDFDGVALEARVGWPSLLNFDFKLSVRVMMNQHETLFHRHPANPILTAKEWPYSMNSVFNAGATLLPDGSTLLLCRVEDRRGLSHLCAARSMNGVDEWRIDREPTLMPKPSQYPEELWGIEDPRITYVPELKQFAVAYTSYSRGGPGVSLALTKDFRTFERLGVVMPPDDKDAALLPRRIDGLWAMIHRPMTSLGTHIWISYSPDLRHWGNHKLMLEARRGTWWDANKIGMSPPPIETRRGWLMIYHGVRRTPSSSIYRLGLALFDLQQPEKCLIRGNSWIFAPEADYERQGDVQDVVFPCGYTLASDGDTINLYYGAADSSVALAHGSIPSLLAWLDANGQPEHAHDRRLRK